MKILWNYYRMIELSITDSAKKKLVKTDILGLRYKQFSGGGVKKIFFQKRKKHDFFNFWNLDVSKMDWNNGFNSSFFVGFPNNPNLDVSGHFGCKFFFWWLPLSAKAVSIYRLTGSRELKSGAATSYNSRGGLSFAHLFTGSTLAHAMIIHKTASFIIHHISHFSMFPMALGTM